MHDDIEYQARILTLESMDALGKTGRIDSLDGLRGVACLCVLLLHIGMVIHPFGEGVNYALMPGTPAVMVFYVLSGVVLSIIPFACLDQGKSYDWFGYFPRRVVRLCVPLFAAVAIGIVIGFASQFFGLSSRSAEAISYSSGIDRTIHDILMQFDVLFNVSNGEVTLYGEPLVRVDSPVWSMSWELWFSIALPLVVYVAVKCKRDWMAFAAIVFAIFVSHFSGYFPLRLCLMFALGVLLAKHMDWFAKRRLPLVLEVLAILAAITLIELPSIIAVGTIMSAVLKTLMNLACMALVVIAMTNGILNRFLSCGACRWLGKVSYSMYLTHAMAVSGFAAILPKLGLVNPILISAVSILASFVIAWVFWRLIEKPSIALSRRFQSQGK